MRSRSTPRGSTLVCTLRYRDATAAVEWLCRAFGFEPHLVVPGPEGQVVHAQLRFGSGMVMLGPAGEGEFDAVQRPPDRGSDPNARAPVVTQSAYGIVEDADAHYARAVAAGAEIVIPIRDEDYGGRGYTCRDPEGHVWNFGSYDPWAEAEDEGPSGGDSP